MITDETISNLHDLADEAKSCDSTIQCDIIRTAAHFIEHEGDDKGVAIAMLILHEMSDILMGDTDHIFNAVTMIAAAQRT